MSRVVSSLVVDEGLRRSARLRSQGGLKWDPIQETDMRYVGKVLGRLVRDEQGGEVLEYALIAGLIVVAAIAIISSVGTKVLARWTSLDSST